MSIKERILSEKHFVKCWGQSQETDKKENAVQGHDAITENYESRLDSYQGEY